MRYLVIVDTAQIQPYVFGSNRLRENIGASHLVAEATTTWALEALDTVAPRNNGKKPTGDEPDASTFDILTREDVDAEIIHNGGGNFVALLRREGAARDFTRILTRTVMKRAPGLRVIVESFQFESGVEQLAKVYDQSVRDLARAKVSRAFSAPLLGLAVTKKCRSTGLPAAQMTKPIAGDDESVFPASSEIHAKRDAIDAADDRLAAIVPPGEGFRYPRRLDDLGRSMGEHSYYAVVHVDGDGLGDLVRAIGVTGTDREFIDDLSAFSDGVERAARGAVAAMRSRLVEEIDTKTGIIVHTRDGNEIGRVELARPKSGKEWYLPFRPIVFGGDDVTFVCDGRLGLSLALLFIETFGNLTEKDEACGGRISASAGIAIVKSHYPFSAAYALADELARSAKSFRKESGGTGPYLDWHFAVSGLSGNLQEIRQREYTVKQGKLTLRPVALALPTAEDIRSWEVVRRGVNGFQGPDWFERRNKSKALREALRDGVDEIERFRAIYKLRLPKLDCPEGDTENTGWFMNSWCGYFDALELADWFHPLDPEQEDVP